MIIETIDIYQEERNLTRYDSKVVDKCPDEKLSKSEGQDEDLAEAEVVDVTEEWMESMRCIDNVQFDFQGPNYIHPESDIKSRPSITSREQLRTMYPECFTGIDTFKNYKYHIELDKNAKPVVHPVKKIALTLIPKLDKELDNMLADGIIVPVDEPTDWVNSHVVMMMMMMMMMMIIIIIIIIILIIIMKHLV